MITKQPSSEVDLYSDAVLRDPYPHYRSLRDAGPAVWMTNGEYWTLARYQEVTEALRNTAVFSSARGVTLNEVGNQAQAGTMLASDDPLHLSLRKIFAEPLRLAALTSLRETFQREADALVDRLVALETFDAVSQLARYLPLTIVRTLVGLPEEGRERMLDWASAIFDVFGPIDNPRTVAAFPWIEEVGNYVRNPQTIANLAPGSWAARLFEFVERGELSAEQAMAMLLDYTGPALDTTINATGAAIWLFTQHPDQWDVLREHPELIRSAIEEVIRLESPIRGFSRYVTRDHAFEHVTVPAGSRVLVLYASANRDERKWTDPDTFDVRRNPLGHVGFGHGAHACAGMHLAKLEIEVLLTALLRSVRRFELVESRRLMHNTLQGFEFVRVRVVRT